MLPSDRSLSGRGSSDEDEKGENIHQMNEFLVNQDIEWQRKINRIQSQLPGRRTRAAAATCPSRLVCCASPAETCSSSRTAPSGPWDTPRVSAELTIFNAKSIIFNTKSII